MATECIYFKTKCLTIKYKLFIGPTNVWEEVLASGGEQGGKLGRIDPVFYYNNFISDPNFAKLDGWNGVAPAGTLRVVLKHTFLLASKGAAVVVSAE